MLYEDAATLAHILSHFLRLSAERLPAAVCCCLPRTLPLFLLIIYFCQAAAAASSFIYILPFFLHSFFPFSLSFSLHSSWLLKNLCMSLLIYERRRRPAKPALSLATVSLPGIFCSLPFPSLLCPFFASRLVSGSAAQRRSPKVAGSNQRRSAALNESFVGERRCR